LHGAKLMQRDRIRIQLVTWSNDPSYMFVPPEPAAQARGRTLRAAARRLRRRIARWLRAT